jgi:hypothetical protein
MMAVQKIILDGEEDWEQARDSLGTLKDTVLAKKQCQQKEQFRVRTINLS